MILVIGEILMDIFPEYRRIGGAPFNFSYHLYNFGLPVKFISRIGKDETGSQILDFLRKNDFDPGSIQVDPERPTGRVLVHPDSKEGHRFEIVEDVAYDRIELPESPESLAGTAPEMIYFGTLVQRTPDAFRQIQSFLKNRNPETRCFCDINLRPGCYSTETVRNSLYQADILKINSEEIETVRKMHGSSPGEEEFVAWLMKNYRIELVSLTRGREGSELYDGNSRHTIGVPESGPIKDTVGAGDAYAAVLALGYLKGWPAEKILSNAADFSAQICTIQGAVARDRSFYETFINRVTGETNA
ncbi:MAG: PfkB family carbohydrate kinase [Desulfobacterales bacterium]